MDIEFSAEKGLEIRVGSRRFLSGLNFYFRFQSGVLTEADLDAGPWEERPDIDALGSYRELRRTYSHEGEPLVELTIQDYGSALLIAGKLLRRLSGLLGSLSFTDPAIVLPGFKVGEGTRFFAWTFGLDGALGRYPGGYWPEAGWGASPAEMPAQPFAPLVLWGEGGALTIAPADHFLLSPLMRTAFGVGRALAGQFEEIPAGLTLGTWVAFGKDPGEALLRLGDLLLKTAGKNRADPEENPLLSRLGYWNAYGSYYTELIHPLGEELLLGLARSFGEKGIPVGYFGLDLWYPYSRIGQAKEFRPDRRKYPRGLAALSRETGIPFVFHLSALSPDNAYRADGTDPTVYATIAQDLRAEGAVAVWHDWLRTWQFTTPKLLSDPWAAERWFSGMAGAFRERDLPVLLCMQTMGMVLASTREQNIVAARSFTDHLFSQKLALALAKETEPGIERAWMRSVDIWEQNLLVGFVQWALGLRPFYDLFLSSLHPGFGGEHALQEAILRALSCGPVGFGDELGRADVKLLSRLVLPGGWLAQPDQPPIPVWHTLGTDLPEFTAVHRRGEAFWVYWIALNKGKEARRMRPEPPVVGSFVAWDPLAHELASEWVTVPPESLAYLVFVSSRGGIAPLGLPGLLVPAPAALSWELEWDKTWVWQMSKDLPSAWVLKDSKLLPAEEAVRTVRRG